MVTVSIVPKNIVVVTEIVLQGLADIDVNDHLETISATKVKAILL